MKTTQNLYNLKMIAAAAGTSLGQAMKTSTSLLDGAG